ncbi:MAG: formimidoylglutamase [Anaerolineae bacterium]|nr:formimidoylglutamase [Anaerolineae bacterium]
MTFDLFEQTRRPDSQLLYRRNDPNDPRLGELVSASPDVYASSQVVLLGCPQDEGVSRNQGRLGAHLAPDEIRRCFYRLAVGTLAEHHPLNLFDLGNTIIQPTLEETHNLHQKIVRQLIADGKIVIMLGGGNDVSYPDCSALALETGDVLAFNIDAHFDVRADSPRNSGTPYRQLLEEKHIKPEQFYEVGNQPFSNSPIYRRYLLDQGANICNLRELQESGITPYFENVLKRSPNKAIFWGIDLDVVRAADAPGVSAPNPVGMGGEDLCRITELAGCDPRTRIIEFSEVNPEYDIDQRTCRLAAAAIFYCLLGFQNRN